MSISQLADGIIEEIGKIKPVKITGKVTAVKGLLLEVGGIEWALCVGARCKIVLRGGEYLQAEVVGFREDRALLMPFGSLDGIALGAEVEMADAANSLYPSNDWLGRVLNAFGEPIDGKGAVNGGINAVALNNKPPRASARGRVGDKLDMGIRALNTFLTMCKGQRMGIFAGSGVGKSTMMSMIAKYSTADVNVIGLIGERGRELKEFIEDDLGEEGLKRSVVIAATSDESALMRRTAAMATLSVAEYFRDQGKQVLCMMDSLTRYCMSLREIGLSAGEPPTTKGYTPSVFAELPKLLERAGPGEGSGSITGLFTVLVEGDDHNEPVADAVRGILDGHIVLERGIAERGRYPSINILRSVSRVMPNCNTEKQNQIISKARRLMSTYEDMAEMIRLGAYRRGTDPEVDNAIKHHPLLESFLSQSREEKIDLESGYLELAKIVGVEYP